jgi:hypothetical protein
MFWNANSTLVASRAEVSMKERLFSAEATNAHHQHKFTYSQLFLEYQPAISFASSVVTALKCLKSLLFPTNMITILLSA